MLPVVSACTGAVCFGFLAWPSSSPSGPSQGGDDRRKVGMHPLAQKLIALDAPRTLPALDGGSTLGDGKGGDSDHCQVLQ